MLCIISYLIIPSNCLNTDENIDDINNKIERPKVSIVIPVYNVEPYLRECLDSVKNQTLKEIEIICVDDGSPDNCGAILDEYAQNDKRFKVIHQENQGLSGARNTGLDNITGEYVIFLDSDDYLDLNACEELYKTAKSHNLDVLRFASRSFPEKRWVETPRDYFIVIKNATDLSKIPQQVYVTNKLYRTSMLQESNVRFIKMNPDEDICFNLMVRPWIKRFESTKRVFYNLRARPGSIMSTYHQGKLKNLHLYFNIIPNVCDTWRKKNVIKGNEKYLLTTLITLISKIIAHFRILKNAGENYSKKILDSFGSDIYNKKVISRCDSNTKSRIYELENDAGYAHKVKKTDIE